jgi:hypothetical protein
VPLSEIWYGTLLLHSRSGAQSNEVSRNVDQKEVRPEPLMPVKRVSGDNLQRKATDVLPTQYLLFPRLLFKHERLQMLFTFAAASYFNAYNLPKTNSYIFDKIRSLFTPEFRRPLGVAVTILLSMEAAQAGM